MKKYNISRPEKYIKDGVEKTFWANVGTMTEFTKQDGTVSRIVEIPAIGLKASVFEQQDRNTQPAPARTTQTVAPRDDEGYDSMQVNQDENSMEGIPF